MVEGSVLLLLVLVLVLLVLPVVLLLPAPPPPLGGAVKAAALASLRAARALRRAIKTQAAAHSFVSLLLIMASLLAMAFTVAAEAAALLVSLTALSWRALRASAAAYSTSPALGT